MSLKDNYIELSKKLGGPYTLTKKGIKESVISSIMQGHMPRASSLYDISKVLNTTMEELLTGKPLETEVSIISEPTPEYGSKPPEDLSVYEAMKLVIKGPEFKKTVMDIIKDSLELIEEEGTKPKFPKYHSVIDKIPASGPCVVCGGSKIVVQCKDSTFELCKKGCNKADFDQIIWTKWLIDNKK